MKISRTKCVKLVIPDISILLKILLCSAFFTFFLENGYCANGDKWIVNVTCGHPIFNISAPSSNEEIRMTARKFNPGYLLEKISGGKSVYSEQMYLDPGWAPILDPTLDIDKDFKVSFDQFGQTGGVFKIRRSIGSYIGSFTCPNSPIGAFSGTFKILELTGILTEKNQRLYGALISSEPLNGETIYLIIGEGKGQSSFWKYTGRTYISSLTPPNFYVSADSNDPLSIPYGVFYGSATRIPTGPSGLGLLVQISDKPNGPWTSIVTITNSIPKIYTNQFYRIMIK